MRRRSVIGALASLGIVGPAFSQSPRLRVGVLVLTTADGRLFESEFRERGRELGRNDISLEIRSADGVGSRLASLAAELVDSKVDIIAAVFTPCALAAKQATSKTPIVVISVGDPIGTGLVENLARPGGNITGISNLGAEMSGKCVELLHVMLPSLRKVAALVNPLDAFTTPFLERVRLGGKAAGVEIGPIAAAQGSDDLENAFAKIASEGADAVIVQAVFFPKSVANLAIKHRLPSASVFRAFTSAGGLMSYGADVRHLHRRGAELIYKILQGAKPADIPVEQPTRFELVINAQTAKSIGLSIPESFFDSRR